MEVAGVLNHFFRHEYGKLTSRITHLVGTDNIQQAEDIVQDVIEKAFEVWKIKGVPENPEGWLYTAARNKTIDYLRQAKKQNFLTLEKLVDQSFPEVHREDPDDQQIRMMFVCCHPSLSEESQVALMLKTLSAFSVAEIARAFITNEETIAKRLYRAKEQFRNDPVSFELPDATDLLPRLDSVLKTIYLIYHEGFHSTHHATPIREELIEEAIRLLSIIIEHPVGKQPQSLALMALFCFHTARIPARMDHHDQILTLPEQDRSRWNQEMIRAGENFLSQASRGDTISRYHLEAAIAFEHCSAKHYSNTRWDRILKYYDLWLTIQPDPVIQLNRMVALAEVRGAADALKELDLLLNDKLKDYYLYYAIAAELHTRLNNPLDAKINWEQARMRTQSPREIELIDRKLKILDFQLRKDSF